MAGRGLVVESGGMSQQTFIPQPPPTAPPGPFLSPGPGERAPASEHSISTPAAWLVSADTQLIDQVALVAAAAGTELLVGEVAAEAAARDAVVLVGYDQLERIGETASVAVIALGFGEHVDRLWQAAARHPGARVAVLPEASAWLGEYLGERGLRHGAGTVLECAGLTGGAGTTTLAILTAAAAAADGRSVLLVDADPASAGLTHLLGPEAREASGLGWQDVGSAVGRVRGRQLADVLPEAAGFSYVTWGSERTVVREETLAEVIGSARQAFDVVVVDAGRCSAGAPAHRSAEVVDASIVAVPAERTWPPAAVGSGRDQFAAVIGNLPGGRDVRGLAAEAGLEPLLHVPRLRRLKRATETGLPAAVASRTVRRALGPLRQWWSA